MSSAPDPMATTPTTTAATDNPASTSRRDPRCDGAPAVAIIASVPPRTTGDLQATRGLHVENTGDGVGVMLQTYHARAGYIRERAAAAVALRCGQSSQK